MPLYKQEMHLITRLSFGEFGNCFLYYTHICQLWENKFKWKLSRFTNNRIIDCWIHLFLINSSTKSSQDPFQSCQLNESSYSGSSTLNSLDWNGPNLLYNQQAFLHFYCFTSSGQSWINYPFKILRSKILRLLLP